MLSDSVEWYKRFEANKLYEEFDVRWSNDVLGFGYQRDRSTRSMEQAIYSVKTLRPKDFDLRSRPKLKLD